MGSRWNEADTALMKARMAFDKAVSRLSFLDRPRKGLHQGLVAQMLEIRRRATEVIEAEKTAAGYE
jgi:hypothetical protein